jgi:hypothetical protein
MSRSALVFRVRGLRFGICGFPHLVRASCRARNLSADYLIQAFNDKAEFFG